MFNKGIAVRAGGQARPLHFPKLLRHHGLRIGGAVDDDREQEGSALGHVESASHRKIPLTPEVAFLARLRVRRDDRHKQVTALDLPADQRIPGIASAKLALVEPHLDPRGTQRIAQLLRRVGVLGRVTQEHWSARIGHGAPVAVGPLRLSGSLRSASMGLSVSASSAYPKCRAPAILPPFRLLECLKVAGQRPPLSARSGRGPHLRIPDAVTIVRSLKA